MAQQERQKRLALLAQIPARRRAHPHRSRTASCTTSGTQIPFNSPARSSRTRLTASRRFVLTRSPGRFAAQRHSSADRARRSAGRARSRSAGFVTEMQARVLFPQPAHEALDRRRPRFDLAEIPDLPIAATLGNRNGVLRLGHVDTDLKNPILLHGPPFLRLRLGSGTPRAGPPLRPRS